MFEHSRAARSACIGVARTRFFDDGSTPTELVPHADPALVGALPIARTRRIGSTGFRGHRARTAERVP